MAKTTMGKTSLVLATLLTTCSAYTPPNLVMVLADDIGWSDFGYFGFDLVNATPTIDQLAMNGVRLYTVYGSIACSPGRAAFLTGRYPMRFGMQKGAINAAQRKGIFLNESLISDQMKLAGYETLMVGKWHVGHAAWIQTPTRRGFDSYYGFMCNGDMDYLTKTANNYIDLYNDDQREEDEYALSEDVRSSWLFEAKVEDFVANHRANKPDDPFFIYIALQDPHTPLSSPDYFLESEPCASLTNENRQIYCGMMRCIDSSVQGLMAALSDNGYIGNTIVFFSGDNGGAPKNGGFNWPLRGSKGTLYEGGIRQASWVWGAMLSDQVRGTTYEGAIHLVDMLPTFMGLASGGHWQPDANKKLDGVDVWEAIATGGESPRNVTLLNVIDDSGGIRMGDWVLLYNMGEDGWYNPFEYGDAMYTPPPEKEMIKHRRFLAANKGKDRITRSEGDSYYLFDVKNDPEQYTDLADTYPDVVSAMLTLLDEYINEAVDYNLDSDKEDEAKSVAAETGYWGPWLSDDVFTTTTASPEVQAHDDKVVAANKGSIATEY